GRVTSSRIAGPIGCAWQPMMVRYPTGVGGTLMAPKRLVAVSTALLIFALAGCEAGGMRMGPGTATGGLGGAAAGGLLGAALGGGSTGIASGVLLGGLLGAGMGQMLDQRSQQIQSQTVSRTLETAQSGTTTSWVNPDNGSRGTVTPLRT